MSDTEDSFGDELDNPVDDDSDFCEGERYLVQTTTLYFFTGECCKVTDTHVWFTNAAWVQEMGRMSRFMRESGGVAQYAEFMFERQLRIAKNQIVFDVQIDNLLTRSVNNGNQE